MTPSEISKYIHEQIMGKCWGIGREFGPTGCENCHESAHNHDHPPYCSDDSPRRLLTEVVAKVDNDSLVDACIEEQAGYASYNIQATAEQIARACVDVHKSSGNHSKAKDSTETPTSGEVK